MKFASPPFIGSEFNAFLFAWIGPESNGTLLSVLSALARMNVDPWQEAAKLANLPQNAAAERLTGLIARLPDPPKTAMGDEMNALRLIALLPRQGQPVTPPQDQVIVAGKAVNWRMALCAALLASIVVIQVIAMISREQSPQGEYAEPTLGAPHAPDNS